MNSHMSSLYLPSVSCIVLLLPYFHYVIGSIIVFPLICYLLFKEDPDIPSTSSNGWCDENVVEMTRIEMVHIIMGNLPGSKGSVCNSSFEMVTAKREVYIDHYDDMIIMEEMYVESVLYNDSCEGKDYTTFMHEEIEMNAFEELNRKSIDSYWMHSGKAVEDCSRNLIENTEEQTISSDDKYAEVDNESEKNELSAQTFPIFNKDDEVVDRLSNSDTSTEIVRREDEVRSEVIVSDEEIVHDALKHSARTSTDDVDDFVDDSNINTESNAKDNSDDNIRESEFAGGHLDEEDTNLTEAQSYGSRNQTSSEPEVDVIEELIRVNLSDCENERDTPGSQSPPPEAETAETVLLAGNSVLNDMDASSLSKKYNVQKCSFVGIRSIEIMTEALTRCLKKRPHYVIIHLACDGRSRTSMKSVVQKLNLLKTHVANCLPSAHVVVCCPSVQVPSKEPSLICGCAPWKCKVISGIAVVIVIAFSWTGSTQFAKSTYSKNFHAPFFVTWYNTCFMVVVYPLFMIPLVCKKTPWRLRTFLRHTASIFGPNGFCLKSLVGYLLKRIIPFCTIWMVTNYFYIQALSKLFPGTVTAIFSVSSCFVYVLSLICLKDKFYLVRVGAMCLTISGIVLMGYVEGFGKTDSYTGVIFVLLAALGSAFYQVLFKRVMGESSGSQVALYLTLLGLVNMFLLAPILFLLDYLNWEVITWDRIPWVNLNGTALLNAVFNYFVNFGISITFPLFISIGISVGLPVNAVADSFFRGDSFGVLKIVALLLILAGFLMMLIPSEKLRRFEPCTSNEVSSGTERTSDISGGNS